MIGYAKNTTGYNKYDAPVSERMPCDETTRDSFAALCLKGLHDAQDRLNIISLHLRDKLEPVCTTQMNMPCDAEKPLPDYPPLFNEMREVTRRLHETADRLESVYSRCEL